MKALATLSADDRLVVGMMGATLAGLALGAAFAAPAIFGVTAVAVFVLLVAGAVSTRSVRLAWLLPFGLVAGVLELWADWVHVAFIHSLVYTDFFGFRLLASPSYMPIGWCTLVVEFGYLALRLREFWPGPRVAGALTVLGIALPPLYEQLAAPAHAWHYAPRGIMLSYTPLWVVGTYAGCVLAITTATLLFYEARAWGKALFAGAFVGMALLFSGVFWFWLLGR